MLKFILNRIQLIVFLFSGIINSATLEIIEDFEQIENKDLYDTEAIALTDSRLLNLFKNMVLNLNYEDQEKFKELALNDSLAFIEVDIDNKIIVLGSKAKRNEEEVAWKIKDTLPDFWRTHFLQRINEYEENAEERADYRSYNLAFIAIGLGGISLTPLGMLIMYHAPFITMCCLIGSGCSYSGPPCERNNLYHSIHESMGHRFSVPYPSSPRGWSYEDSLFYTELINPLYYLFTGNWF